jgi:hypothetical protein
MNDNDFSALTEAGTTEGAFIEAQDFKTVFITAHVPLGLLGDLEVYRDRKRTVAQWEEFLTGIKASALSFAATESDRVEFFEYVTGDAEGVHTKTPFKKRKAVDLTTPDSQFEDIDNFLEAVAPGLDEDDTMRHLRSEWPGVVQNLKVLHRRLEACQDLIGSELRKVDFTIAGVANKLGNKPPTMPAGSVFELVEAVNGRVETLSPMLFEHSAEVAKLMGFVAGVDTKTPLLRMFAEFSQEVQKVVEPLWQLMLLFSTDSATPGDKCMPLLGLLNAWPKEGVGKVSDLLAWAQTLEVRMSMAEHQLGGGRGTPGMSLGGASAGYGGQQGMGRTFGAGGMQGFGLGGVTSSGGNPGGSYQSQGAGGAATIQISAAAWATMCQEVSDLKAQADIQAVTVQQEVFRGLQQVGSWMSINAPASGSQIYFCDAVGLLALTNRDQASLYEFSKFESTTGGKGFATTSDSKLAFSFTLELPQVFGKDAAGNVLTTDLRVLPGVKDYDTWNGEGGIGGVKNTLQHMIDFDMAGHVALAEVNLGTREGWIVAESMMNESREFLRLLSQWMTDYYLALTARAHKPKDAWEVVSRSVRAIFKELSKARIPGRGHQTMGGLRGQAQMWACLQGLKVQREFITAGFVAHKAIVAIVHKYLLDSSVTKETHTTALAALETRLTTVITNKMSELKRAGQNRNG